MYLKPYLFLFCVLPCIVNCEIITATSYILIAAASWYYGSDFARAGLRVLDIAVCSTGFRLHECCGKPWIAPNVDGLRSDLQIHLFGQHIVEDTIPAAISASIRERSPTKPLVMSFHGWTGGGKNYVASFIAQNYYSNTENSKFYHFFNGRTDFPFQNQVSSYQSQLRDWIRGNVTECPHSMFVFDEVEKMPKGILDGIKPFLDHHTSINGVDYRRAIFIFISNIGGSIIMERYLELWRENGKIRENMKLNDFDQVITKVAFNMEGGFKYSDVVDHSLIDHYVPFLPLEKMHVEACIKHSLDNEEYPHDLEIIEEVMKSVTFGPKPETLFAHAGCKRLDTKVRAIVEQKRYQKWKRSYEV